MEGLIEYLKTSPSNAVIVLVLIVIASKVLKLGKKVFTLLLIAGLAYLMYTYYNGYIL